MATATPSPAPAAAAPVRGRVAATARERPERPRSLSTAIVGLMAITCRPTAWSRMTAPASAASTAKIMRPALNTSMVSLGAAR